MYSLLLRIVSAGWCD
ncbi:hypothetical protein [Escherichia coli]|nr:hypothetical protein [Escherichia coli]